MRASLLALFPLALAACLDGPSAPTERAPGWDSHAREVFDDNVDPAAVGLSLEGPSARADRFLRERAQTAELVSVVRVDTVTIDSIGDAKRFHLGVRVTGAPAGLPRLEAKEFDLRVSDGNALLGAGFEQRLRGHTFIGFMHRYSNEEGDPVVHFHLSANTPEIAHAVQEALALQEFSR
jgi:hypothetical protein